MNDDEQPGAAPAPQRRRVRRRTRNHPRRRALRTVGRIVAAVVVVGAVLLGAEAIAARDALESARASLDEARTALSDGDLDRASEHARSTQVAIDRARARTSGPHWWLAARIPVVGETPQVVRRVVPVVAVANEILAEGLDVGRDILDGEAGLPLRSEDGRLDLAPIQEAAAALEALPLEQLRSARAELAASPDRWLTRSVRAGRGEALHAADELLRTVDQAQLAAEVLPALLGADTPRRYLLMVQNPGELRGTGGLVGFLAELRVDDGAVTLGEPEGVDPLAMVEGSGIVARGRFDRAIPGDVARPAAFADRYDHIAAGRLLVNTNADPDLPTVAPVVIRIYEQTTGQALDGVIALDPVGLQYLYETIGPLEVPAEVAATAPGLPNPIPPAMIAEVLLIDSYEVLGGPTEERRAYQTTIASVALERFLAADWDSVAVGRAFGEALAGRNLQVFSTVDAEQAALEALGVAGELRTVRDGDDLLAVTGNNAAATKGDVHVSHHLTATIELDRPRRQAGEEVVDRRLTTRMQVHNAIDPASDDYIARSVRTQRIGDVSEVDPRRALTRTWFSQWIATDDVITSVRTTTGDVAPFGTGAIHGRRVIDHFLETPQGQTTGFETVVDTTLPIGWDGWRLTYAVTLWRQGKAIADHLDVSVQPPRGFRIVDATAEGGGRPAGLGPAPTGEPVSVSIRDGVVRLEGAMTADTRLVVTMEPA